MGLAAERAASTGPRAQAVLHIQVSGSSDNVYGQVFGHARAVAASIDQKWKARCALGHDPVAGVLLVLVHASSALKVEAMKGLLMRI